MAEFPVSDPLADYLARVIGRDFGFGQWDCALFCAEWFHVKQGVDPAAAWRGRYRGAPGGGLVALFDQALIAAGSRRTDNPQRGDIAVVATAQGETGAIVTGENVVMVGTRGLITRHRSRAPILAAWSL